MKPYILAASLGAVACTAVAATADTAITVPYDGSFDDAAFAVESAIVDHGLVIDYVSHVGEMLTRTGADVGSDVELFREADIFIFCSAVVSREVMEADLMNIAHCPYGIFVADTGGSVVIGYRSYPDGAMQKVQTLLSDIVADAVGE